MNHSNPSPGATHCSKGAMGHGEGEGGGRKTGLSGSCRRTAPFGATRSALLCSAFLLVGCGLPSIPDSWAKKGVGFAPVVLLHSVGLGMELGRQRISSAQGNGFFVSSKGCLVTSYHWFRRKKENLILDPSYNSSRARMVGSAPQNDIAMMRAEGARDVPFFRLTEEVYPPEPGEKYLMLSRPGSVTLIYAVSRWQTSVPVKGKKEEGPNGLAVDVQEGNFKAYLFRGKGETGQSGSPVVNRNGEVFGMFIAGDSDKDLLVVIPLSRAMLRGLWGDC